MANQIAVTLRRSLIGCSEKQRRTAEALGLRKLQQTVIHNDNDSVRGMLKVVSHLVEVKEVQ